MKLQDLYLGDKDPLEGDRKLWLRSLPEGARVTKATVTLTPKGGPEFLETFAFDGFVDEGDLPADNWGVSRTPPGVFIEVDFHARRTLAGVLGVKGGNVEVITLQVDLGGAYVGVANDGTIIADKKAPWTVDLSPSDLSPLPGLTVNKFRLNGTPSGSNSIFFITKVTIRSVPTNVSVRLGEMPPFWTRLGELATAQTSPDFAAVLNAFLAEAKAIDGFYSIPFVVHSDAIARLDVKLAIDYVIEQPVLPSYLPEVTLPYGYSSLPGVEEDLLTMKIPRGATIVSAVGAVQGSFEATRIVFGEMGESQATGTVAVSPDRSLAQPIQLDEETPVRGIDLPLANTVPGLAGLHLALQEDADGKPSGKVISSANVSVERPVPGGSSWGSAALPAEFRFLSSERYWLVVQSVSGDAHWDIRPGDPEAPVLQTSNDGGFSWRMAATDAGEKNLAAIFRLRHSPERFKVPLQLQIGRGHDARRASFDRFAPLGRVEFEADFAAELSGYLASPTMAPPCGRGELLTNGSFSNPPPVESEESGEGSQTEIRCWPEVPTDWNGIPGRVLRWKNLYTDQIFAVLLAMKYVYPGKSEYFPGTYIEFCFASDQATLKALTGEPAELSQRFSVISGCAYMLSVRFPVLNAQYEGDFLSTASVKPPSWQIRWLDADGESQAIDGEPLDFESCSKEEVIYETRVTAPSGATEAEICFVQPSPGILFLESVSFSPTLETLSNGFFVISRDNVIPGWQLLGGESRGDDDGVVLEGLGSEDAVLTQTAQINAGESYTLKVCARHLPSAADDVETLPSEERARFELRWLTDEGEISEPAILPLDGRDFPEHAWIGDAPSEATQAEIRLIQPQGQGGLLVESVSLVRSDLVQVPLIFLAEAPGELVVSNLRVAYDLPAPFGPKRQAALKRLSPDVKQKGLPNLAKKDASFISGVGDFYSEKISIFLEGEGKKFDIGDLAAINILKEIKDVPRERALEMKAAAEMALACASMAGSDRFASLADRSLNSLLKTSPKELAGETGQAEERVEQLQKNLRALKLLLKNEAFLNLKLRDLMPSR